MKKAPSWNDSSKFLIIGHRGSPRIAPENTRESFKKALEEGANGVELDARLCLDKQLVVSHDDKISSTGEVKVISETQLAKLRPLLPELKEVVASMDALVNIEIKTNYENLDISFSYNEIAKALSFLKNLPPKKLDSILISSFNHELISYLSRILEARISYGFLAVTFEDSTQYLLESVPSSYLNLEYSQTEKAIKKVAPSSLIAWTVNDEDDLIKMFELRIKGVITDIPGHAFKILNNLI